MSKNKNKKDTSTGATQTTGKSSRAGNLETLQMFRDHATPPKHFCEYINLFIMFQTLLVE